MAGSKKSFKNNVAGADKLFSVNDTERTPYTSSVSDTLDGDDVSNTLGASGGDSVPGGSDIQDASDVSNVFDASDTSCAPGVSDARGTQYTTDTFGGLSARDVSGASGLLGVADASFVADINKLKSNYRFNLKLDEGYREYIQEAAWLSRMTITEYLNNLIKEDKDKRERTTH